MGYFNKVLRIFQQSLCNFMVYFDKVQEIWDISIKFRGNGIFQQSLGYITSKFRGYGIFQQSLGDMEYFNKV